MTPIRFLTIYAVTALTLFGHVAGALTDWSQKHPHALNESECTTVDLRPILGPARNQGNIGWCYANATADLLTFEYHDILKGERVSAGYTALVFNENKNSTALGEGGWVDQAMKFAEREGLCPESIEQDVLSSGPKMSIKKKLETFVNFKRLYDEAQKDPVARRAFQKQADIYRASDSTLFDLKSKQINALLATTTQATFPLEFAKMLCADKKIMPPPPYPKMSSIDKESFGKYWVKLSPYIHQQLEAGKPVAIAYAANFLTTANVPNWEFSWTKSAFGKDGDVGRHASSIVGRRWNGKSCEFILRNSWGTGCHYGNPNLRKPGKCEDGHLFINEEYMESQMYEIFYFSGTWLSDLYNRANAVIN